MNASVSSQTSADLALAVYLEPHADQRRVLVLSGVDAPLSRHLTAVAEHLDVIDPTSRAEGGGEVPELPFDDESFDLIVVADASALPEPLRDALRELRRTLARDGLLAIAVSAGDKGGETLERLGAREFTGIKVFEQTPTLGYTLHDTDAERAELSIDRSLLRDSGERSERTVLLLSDARPKLESRLWVQLPAEEMIPARGAELNPRWVESLRKAEDEARSVLAREAELLRELSREKKARELAEASKERTKALERKLLAIEADYDDAVGRVRYFEGLLLEREAQEEAERGHGKGAERELSRLRDELSRVESKLKAAEAEQASLRAGEGDVASESAEYERRLAELGSELSASLRETKRHEKIARDLLEELRGLEQRALATVEQDARVAELEAERERAMQRALEAEVARESAQMRVDELRAQLDQPVAAAHAGRPSPERDELLAERDRLAHELEALRRHQSDELEAQRQLESDQALQISALRGERSGLRLRLDESERALLAFEQAASDGGRELDTRLSLAEARADAAISALGVAETSLKSLRSEVDQAEASRGQQHGDPNEKAELEAQLSRAQHRIESLERELEEADRFAEESAEDLNRLDALESELDGTRQKLEQVDDEVRLLQDELIARKTSLQQLESERQGREELLSQARAEVVRLASEQAVRFDQLARRETELSAERDDAHAALAEARAILSHLAARVGADTHDLPAIMQALDQHAAPPSTLDALRKALVEAQAARSDAEYQLSRISLQLEERESRIRQLEDSVRPDLPTHDRFDPPEV
jgi:chromosome segregation ATPase